MYHTTVCNAQVDILVIFPPIVGMICLCGFEYSNRTCVFTKTTTPRLFTGSVPPPVTNKLCSGLFVVRTTCYLHLTQIRSVLS